ncbi:hypothetical protein NBO_3g0055 [Nosema bombycis CQ1]|uniref:Uncharacterized protein n=1 Tax=Nosema bombycis (strain CQ1 / CVCC 102059) TaxID=578461 RepID=R0MC16_NOSB1|nr:hypothetical protein NBO_3g0055 [Nosema bombycis CQ1]|eukprot:EOB15504.1 hypothetical protein NBO_3g0055 [Nosema bombycis CQ1]
MLSFIDKTNDLINCLLKESENKVNGSLVAFKDLYKKIASSIFDLDVLFVKINLLYEEKINNLIYITTDFKDDFIYLKGIVAGLRKEFERCSVLYANINQFDNTKKACLLRQHQTNITNMRSGFYHKTESDVEKQLGFLKHRFFKSISLFYESFNEIFETENRFFECHFKTFNLMLKDIKECNEKLKVLKENIIKN